MSTRLELTLFLNIGRPVVTQPLLVCFAVNFESFALKKYHWGYPASDVLVPQDTHLQRFL